MTFVTGKFTMVFVFSDFTVNEDFFVRSQRLHFSASPLPFVFGRGSGFVFIGFCNFPCNLNELSSIRMAREAVILFFSGANRVAAIDQEQGNC
jgi:hypothetical protein